MQLCTVGSEKAGRCRNQSRFVSVRSQNSCGVSLEQALQITRCSANVDKATQLHVLISSLIKREQRRIFFWHFAAFGLADAAILRPTHLD